MKKFTSLSARVQLLACTLLLAIGWSWFEARSLASHRSSHAARVAQIEGMRHDLDRVLELRAAPKLAADRERPNDELLAKVRDSLATAAIPIDAWIGNDPSQPVRIPQSPYKQFDVRLSFAELTMRQLVQFASTLVTADPTLSIPRLRLTVPQDRAREAWNVDLTIRYLIYSPFQESIKGERRTEPRRLYGNAGISR